MYYHELFKIQTLLGKKTLTANRKLYVSIKSHTTYLQTISTNTSSSKTVSLVE